MDMTLYPPLGIPTFAFEFILKEMNYTRNLMTEDELEEIVEVIRDVLKFHGGHRDTLSAAYTKGPLEDGDVPSKSSRNDLLDLGYIAKVVVKGKDGFNACTHKGREGYSAKLAIDKFRNDKTMMDKLKTMPSLRLAGI